jgi:hypothetical protein
MSTILQVLAVDPWIAVTAVAVVIAGIYGLIGWFLDEFDL